MKKTAWSLSVLAIVLSLVTVLSKLNLMGQGFELPINTRLIFGIFFLVLGLGLASFLMGVYLKIYDQPEAIELKGPVLLGMDLIFVLSAGLLLFML